MQLTGWLHDAPLLKHVDFPTDEVLGPDASEDQIQDLIRRHGQVFIKPLFIHETLCAMGNAMREHFATHGADAAVRGGEPQRAEPGARLRRAGRHLGGAWPAYRFFGFDGAISEVVNYA